MTSRIVPTNIDGTFPVAGQDNSSQGFRDNFTNIKNNLTFARNEISDLQSKVLLTSALDGSTLSNDLAGTQLIRPQLKAWTQALVNLGDQSGTAVIDFGAGNFHKLNLVGSVDLSLISWPASSGAGALGYGAVRVWAIVNDISYTIGIPESVTIGTNDIAGYDANTRNITFDRTGNYIFDFSSVDSGVNFFIADPMRNRNTFRDSSFYFNSTVNPSLFLGFNSNSLPIGQSIEAHDDTINAVGGMNLICAGNLAAASPHNHYADTGEVPGYSIMSSRGHLAHGILSSVVNDDYIGYVNAIANVAITGSTTWKQISSIDFFAKGANTATGLGGNIAVFTAGDGAINTSQALGIENDQSVKFFGNVITGNTFVPTTSTTAGGVAGQISFDATNIYICIAPGNWKKAALSTF